MPEEITDVAIIKNSVEILKGGGDILIKNRTRSDKAVAIGKKIVSEWAEAINMPDSDEKVIALAALDDRSNKYLINCAAAWKQMGDDRKAVTNVMDTIKSMFTDAEAKVDKVKQSEAATVQSYRNKYVKWKSDRDRLIAKEAEDKANKAREEVDIRANIKGHIQTALATMLSAKKMSVTKTFNEITLENFLQKEEGLRGMSVSLPKESIVTPRLVLFGYAYHDKGELESMVIGTSAGYDFEPFQAQYKDEMETLRQQLIDRLPSKKQELEAFDALLKKQQKEEDERNRLIEESNGKERARLEQEKKLKDAQDDYDRKRLEDERLIREASERKALQEEEDKSKQQIADTIELDKAGGHANVLFEQVTNTAALNVSAPATKTGFVINVKHQAGWMQIFNYWYTEEGAKMALDDFEKKTLRQMKTFCENAAKDTKDKKGTKIETPFLEYVEDIKAINKREKKEAI